MNANMSIRVDLHLIPGRCLLPGKWKETKPKYNIIFTTAGVTVLSNGLYIKSSGGPLQTLPRYLIFTDRSHLQGPRIATGIWLSPNGFLSWSLIGMFDGIAVYDYGWRDLLPPGKPEFSNHLNRRDGPVQIPSLHPWEHQSTLSCVFCLSFVEYLYFLSLSVLICVLHSTISAFVSCHSDIQMAFNATFAHGFQPTPSSPVQACYTSVGNVLACDHSVQDPPSPRPFPPNPPPSPA
jgi:hypothetical protein